MSSCFFSCCLWDSLPLFNFGQFNYIVHWCGFLWVHLIRNSIGFLDLCVSFVPKLGKCSFPISSNTFCAPFSSLLNSYTVSVGLLMLSHQSPSFFFCTGVSSTFLSLSVLIRSSVSFSLLLKLFTVFFQYDYCIHQLYDFCLVLSYIFSCRNSHYDYPFFFQA